jgi:hypothetical protein
MHLEHQWQYLMMVVLLRVVLHSTEGRTKELFAYSKKTVARLMNGIS